MCAGSLLSLCPSALTAQALGGWALENVASTGYQNQLACAEWGEHCVEAPQPTLYNVKDPDGNPM